MAIFRQLYLKHSMNDAKNVSLEHTIFYNQSLNFINNAKS
jgi:hypothetical protein